LEEIRQLFLQHIVQEIEVLSSRFQLTFQLNHQPLTFSEAELS
jgi:hypothetical protein